jgi:nitrogen fixation protein NifU and related proteins
VSALPLSASQSTARLEELYQSVILDHNRRPRNFGELDGASARAEGKNPLCGDEVTVWVRMDGDLIADVRFRGVGCAISRASASIMTAAVKGKTRAEAARLFDRFHDLVTGQVAPAATGDSPAGSVSVASPGAAGADGGLGSLEAFSGVSRFPIRVKCASLSWHTLRSALREGTPPSVAG